MKKLILNAMIIFLNFIYTFFKLLPTQNKIVFMSRLSNGINVDFLLLGKQLQKKYKVIYLCKELNKNLKSVVSYSFHMLIQMYHLATSKVCILDTYSPVVSILRHKKELTVIQIWHAIGTIKKFGKDILGKEEGCDKDISKIMKQHQNYDLIFAASDAYKKYAAAGYGCSIDKILTYTLPKIDLLSDKEYLHQKKNEIFKEYPELEGKKNILYSPTFRKNEDELKNAIEQLANSIDYSKYNLIIKLHRLSKINIKVKNAIIDNKFSSFEMLAVTDKVISDYSCIIFEAGILNIPSYFYNFDMEKYDISRGIAIDYNELPGYSSGDAKEIINCLEKEYDMEYLRKFIKKYVTNTRNCTEKMVKKIEEYM